MNEDMIRDALSDVIADAIELLTMVLMKQVTRPDVVHTLIPAAYAKGEFAKAAGYMAVVVILDKVDSQVIAMKAINKASEIKPLGKYTNDELQKAYAQVQAGYPDDNGYSFNAIASGIMIRDMT